MLLFSQPGFRGFHHHDKRSHLCDNPGLEAVGGPKMKLYHYSMDTKIGKLYCLWEQGGEVLFLGNSARSFDDFKSKTKEVLSPKRHRLLEQELESYLEGRLKRFSVGTRLVYGSPFFIQVLNTLKGIGYGQVVSYRKLAEAAGYPRAWRAAGTVLSKNPVMILIPCHRVIKSSGQIGNFTAGPGIKKFLLKLESAKPATGEAGK